MVQGIEWIIILVVVAVLFIFGPKKIPELMRSIGRSMGEFRRGKAEIERELRESFTDEPGENASVAPLQGVNPREDREPPRDS